MPSLLRPLLLAGAAFALATSSAAAAELPAKRSGVWGQEYSDLKAEAGVRFGVLPNGVRYAIKRNATPTKQAALRLRIGAGSLNEEPGQEGLAHFLEHMAFKGSTHVPAGDMIRILQRKGLAFGPDTNAFTNFDQTVYQLDLPETDDDTLNTGLMLLREIGGELLIAPDQLDSERGVVLSEERLRDSPAYQAQKTELGFTLEGQRVPTRWPIGEVEVLKTAPASRLRAFYERWYRPDNATVVAVGDFDVDAMEAKIRARFGDWKPRAPAAPPPDLGPVERRGEAVKLIVRPGAPQELSVVWAQAYDPSADTYAREQRDTIDQLALAVLNRRLDRLARGANPPFILARAGTDNLLKSARFTTLQVQTSPQGWATALAAAVGEARRIARFGVAPAELAREVTEMRTSLATGAAGAETRRTPAVADEIVEVTNSEDVYTGPVQNAALFERYVKAATPEAVQASLQGAFAGSGPLLTVTSPTPVAGGEAVLKSALDAALAQPIAAPAAQAELRWPYDRFGPAGAVAERREVADLGVTLVRFKNGVRLTVKPTAFSKDEVLVSARIGAGRLSLPKERAVPGWLLPAFAAGGTREFSYDQLQQLLAARVASARLTLGDDAFSLSGATRPADLGAELQLMAAYVTRPGYRPEAAERLKAAVATALPEVESTPEGVLQRDLQRLLHGGDPRWATLPRAPELDAAQPSDLPALVGPALASGPVDVTVVGDVSVDQAIAAVSRTLGALPPRPVRTRETEAALALTFPATGRPPEVELHQGRPDQAVAVIAWPTTDFFTDPQEARAMGVAAQVFENRLVDQVRIAEGATYSPNADSTPSDVFPRFGYVTAQVETPPAKIDAFWRDVAQITADMRARPPTADELERARKPRVEQRLKALQTNAYWSGLLARVQVEPRQLDAIREIVPGIQRVTAADVQRVSQKYLVDDRAWKLIVRSPTPAAGGAELKPIPVTPPPPKTSPEAPPTVITAPPPPAMKAPGATPGPAPHG